MQAKQVREKKFNSKMRGYDKKEVDAYLKELSMVMDNLETNNQYLQQELYDVNNQLDEYREREASVNRSIVVAQQAADRVRADSLNEADLIIQKAESEAQKLLQTAADKANTIVKEKSQLREMSRYYIFQMQGLINNAKEVLDDPQWQELFADQEEEKVETPVLDEVLAGENFQVRNQEADQLYQEALDEAKHKQAQKEFFDQASGDQPAQMPEEAQKLFDEEAEKLDSDN
ncbi:DivIVA domain-containing protein [Aerococcus urinae]|uniref:DivIVA domain-containing protein n=1 Tax=Aerococcus urinae TaxID=1376 RepID=A0ABT4C460_9LACT|nr:DivIVA domain-containing protein [Aerococcus urinae]MCY3053060.1 DivIVA domain-containing protein [Aerococcus urinae]